MKHLFILLLAFSLTGCFSHESTNIDKSWVLSDLSVDGHDVDLPGLNVTLKVETQILNGFAGCNTYKAPYFAQGDKIYLGSEMEVTKIACKQESIMTFESAYLNALERVEYYKLENEKLILIGQGVRLRYDISSE